MPELRDLYDHEAVSRQVVPPPFEHLRGRARRRRQRHLASGTAGVVVLAVLVLTPWLVAGDDGQPPASPPTGSPPSTPYPEFQMEFRDLNHGFALAMSAPDCAGSLWATDDGGSTWSDRGPVPLADATGLGGRDSEHSASCGRPTVAFIGPETLVMMTPMIPPDWNGEDPDDQAAGLPVSYSLSRDGGRTWQGYKPRVRTADTVPEGVLLDQPCLGAAVCRGKRLGWFDPRTGDRVVLRGGLPDKFTGAPPVVAADGSIWLAEASVDRTYRVAASRDRGRTWRTWELPAVEDDVTNLRKVELATVDGETAYFFALQSRKEERGVHPWGLLYRTIDGGGTWRRLTGERPFRAVDTMWVTPDGALVVGDEAGRHHLSTDNGETFRQIDLPELDTVTPTAGGGFIGASYGSGRSYLTEDGWVWETRLALDVDDIRHYLSEDGLNWRPVRAPRP